MTDMLPIQPTFWTLERAVLIAFVCLVLGIAGGWSIRGLRGQDAVAANPVSPSAGSVTAAVQDQAQLKQMADTQAAPLLEMLKVDPQNAELLTGVGNIYYDAHQYSTAIDFYQRVLLLRPSNASVRTDMATAYWYAGDADAAIEEFNKALADSPDNPNTLFNLGLVEWKGKKDAMAAIADWEKLLAANPGYQERGKVEQMLADAKKQAQGTRKQGGL
jgi:cytochrome c-type biogenesis protein CcmH/NrfG